MKVNSIEEYLGTLQQATVETWKSHLKTDKYSDHKALNEFYDDIVDLVDALIEEYQGIHGKVKDLKNMMTTDKQSAIDYLESLREMTRDGKSLFKEDELKSDIDAILSLIDSTIYKLKELKESSQYEGMKSLSSYLTERLNESHSELVSEAREEIYSVELLGCSDRDGLPITVKVYVPKEHAKTFEKYLDSEGGNTVSHASGVTNDYELDY